MTVVLFIYLQVRDDSDVKMECVWECGPDQPCYPDTCCGDKVKLIQPAQECANHDTAIQSKVHVDTRQPAPHGKDNKAADIPQEESIETTLPEDVDNHQVVVKL